MQQLTGLLMSGLIIIFGKMMTMKQK